MRGPGKSLGELDLCDVRTDIGGVVVVRCELDPGKCVMEENRDFILGFRLRDGTAGKEDILLFGGIQRYRVIEFDDSPTVAQRISEPVHSFHVLLCAHKEVQDIIALEGIGGELPDPDVSIV